MQHKNPNFLKFFMMKENIKYLMTEIKIFYENY